MAAGACSDPDRRSATIRGRPFGSGAGLTTALRVAAIGAAATGWGWRHSGRKAWALRGLDVSIEPGERVLLLGPSGSGKSTLVSALAGVLGPDEGETEGALRVSGRAGLLLQDPDSQLVLSRLGDDVAFGCENLGVPRDEIWSRVGRALDEVGLNLPLDHPTEKLSGGQKQRLALAGLLAMHPGMLLLDEPTANLDPAGVVEVRDAVVRSVEESGATLIVIEHRVEVWQDVVDRVIVLGAGGTPVADGPTDYVLRRRGAELAAAGIWVPGHPPFVRKRSRRPGLDLLATRGLVVGRAPGSPVSSVPDLSLRAGSLTAITGANGSGKSTLALTLGGLLKPIDGAVAASDSLADGAGPNPLRWKSAQLAARIGSVFQDPEHQFLAATVRDELAVGPLALRRSGAEVEQLVDELLERLGLAALARANPFTLSGGEKRRLSVGTAIANDPAVLLLDEPTFGQDSLTWASLVELLTERLDSGTAIAVASHDLALVDALADDRIELGS